MGNEQAERGFRRDFGRDEQEGQGERRGPHEHRFGRGHGHGPRGGRMALPLLALGIAGLARARRGHGRPQFGQGPHIGAAALPIMALGIAGMAMAGGDHGRGGFRGGPFPEGRGPFGGNPFGGRGPFGGFPFGGPGGPFGGGGSRAKRGDVRAGILALLNEEPRNGYQIIQELGQRSGGAWRPSSGAVYPALQQLEDEGLIAAAERDGKRTFALTEAGRAYIAAHPDEVNAPWEALRGGFGEGMMEIGGLIHEVALAAMQVVRTGKATQIAEAATLLKNTRRALYRVLAEDAPADKRDTPDGMGRA